MNRNLLYAILLLSPLAGYGQHAPTPGPQRGNGIIKTNTPASFDVSTSAGSVIEFNDAMHLNSGKTLSGFYRLTVTNDMPWVVMVEAAQPFFSSSSPNASTDMPSEIAHLKDSRRGNFMPLSAMPQTLLVGSGAATPETFYVDMKMDPSWNYRPGDYSEEIIFTLSAQ